MNFTPFCKHANRTSGVCETERDGGWGWEQERLPEMRPAPGAYKASLLSSGKVAINTINVISSTDWVIIKDINTFWAFFFPPLE